MVGYDTRARKRPINLSINEDLIEKARGLGVNVSAFLEQRLAEEVVLRQREAFQREAEVVAEALNEVHATHGSPIDEYLDH
ncbi:MAG TPA: type II toxin-antitoxin system CcdA family antitoxin [Gammaproteobacteria bacterium]|jgi:antitoxin CcdA|nr:type II toxin-antitoxin system CcdA family antitoxin [Gammaproteobacteria bacterium]